MENFIIIAIIVLIIGFAAFYIYKAKKSGKKCIGCPDGCSCSAKKGESSACYCCDADSQNKIK